MQVFFTTMKHAFAVQVQLSNFFYKAIAELCMLFLRFFCNAFAYLSARVVMKSQHSAFLGMRHKQYLMNLMDQRSKPLK